MAKIIEMKSPIQIIHCMYCGRKKDMVSSKTKPKNSREFEGKIYDAEPCSECKDMMDKGVIICETKEIVEPAIMPERTGRYISLTLEDFNSIIELPPEIAEKDMRFFYMPQEMFSHLFNKQFEEKSDVNPDKQEKPE